MTQNDAAILAAYISRGYNIIPTQSMAESEAIARVLGIVQQVASGDIVCTTSPRTNEEMKSET